MRGGDGNVNMGALRVVVGCVIFFTDFPVIVVNDAVSIYTRLIYFHRFVSCLHTLLL